MYFSVGEMYSMIEIMDIFWNEEKEKKIELDYLYECVVVVFFLFFFVEDRDLVDVVFGIELSLFEFVFGEWEF